MNRIKVLLICESLASLFSTTFKFQAIAMVGGGSFVSVSQSTNTKWARTQDHVAVEPFVQHLEQLIIDGGYDLDQRVMSSLTWIFVGRIL